MRIQIEISASSTKRILAISATLGILGVAAIGSAVPNNFTRGQTLSADLLNANFRDVETKVAALASVPVGTILPFGGATVPTGFVLCNGAAVSRVGGYAALFAVIGTAYGSGDDTSTFNVPDLRGRVAVGKDDMGGVAAKRLTALSGYATMKLGFAAGVEAHALTVGELAAHTHAVTDPGHGHGASVDKGDFGSSGSCMVKNAGCNGTYPVNISGNTTGISLTSTGSGLPHNNVQPSMITNYIIKY